MSSAVRRRPTTRARLVAPLVVVAAALALSPALVGIGGAQASPAAAGAPAAASAPAVDAPTDTDTSSCTGSVVKTCVQDDPAKFAYYPPVKGTKTGSLATVPPTVTVSQTTTLAYQAVSVTWKNFTPSIAPSGRPFVDINNANQFFYDVGIYECRSADPQLSFYSTDTPEESDCYEADAANAILGTRGLGNSVQTLTSPDGTGSATFTVETGVESNVLGCSSTHPCSLAVVPNFGGRQASATAALPADKVSCDVHNADLKGLQASLTDLGAPCSWADRIVVPLSFAPGTNSCPTTTQFASEGGPDLQKAMDQWRPSWCSLSRPLTLGYDSGVDSSLATSDFTTPAGAFEESTDTAFSNVPAPAYEASQRAFTYAPVANNGVVIAFEIDDPTSGQQVQHVTLDARLMAKMLTLSYALGDGSYPDAVRGYSAYTCVSGPPDVAAGQRGCGATNDLGIYSGHKTPCTATSPQGPACDPAVAGNPTSIVADPEFRALNPALFPVGQPMKISTSSLANGQFLPQLTGGHSETFLALTRWIMSDPDARAFLAGVKDPLSGMHVNTYFKDVAWPSDQYIEEDPGYSGPDSTGRTVAAYGTMQLALNPLASLDKVVQSLLVNQPNDNDPYTVAANCGIGVNPPCSVSAQAPVSVGTRVLFSVMDAADATNFGFPTATLVSGSGDRVDATASSLGHALADTTTNADGITTTPDFTRLAADPAAYPLTTTDYALVPTCHLGAPKAAAITHFLDLAAGPTGQTVGSANGSLSPGYAPLTAAQRAQTRAAVAKVTAQRSCLHAAAAPAPATPATTTAVRGESQSEGAAPAREPAVAASPAASPTASDPGRTLATTSYGVKPRAGGTAWLVLVPALVGGAVLLLAAGPGLWWTTSTASGAAALARFRRVTRL